MVVDFPESTCPMTTMLICVFSFPMLVGYAGLAGAGGGGEGCGNAAAFLGRLQEGEEAGVSKDPPVTAPSQPHRGWLSSLRPHLPAGPRAPIPAGGARPRLAAPAALGRSQPGPGGGQSGYFWPPRTASKSQQDAAFYSVSPSTAVLETPSSQDYVIAASKVPFLLGKTFLRLRAAPAAFSVFPNLRASPPCHGCPGRSRGCPSLRAALAVRGSGDNMVSAKWDGQK